MPTNQIPNRTFDSSTKDADISLTSATLSTGRSTFLFPRIFAEGFVLLILSFCPADYADFRRGICSKYLSFPRRTPIAANSPTAGANLQAVPTNQIPNRTFDSSTKDADISLTSATLSTGRSTFCPADYAGGFALLILSFCPADYADFRRGICSKYLSFPRRTPIAANSLTAGANLQAVPTNQIPNRTFDSSTKDADISLTSATLSTGRSTFLFPQITQGDSFYLSFLFVPQITRIFAEDSQ